MIGKLLILLFVLMALATAHASQYQNEDFDDMEVAPFESLDDIDSNGVDNAFAELSSDSDADADVDAEADQEVDSEADAETEQETEGEVEGESETDAETEADSSADAELAMIEASSSWPPIRGKGQPINRHKRNGIKNIECLDGDCARAVKAKNVKVGSNPVAEPKKLSKLDLALAATKEEIVIRAKELHKEKDWAKKVEGLISEYQAKLNKVTSNIDKLRLQTKSLLKKKKQIQNIQVQKKLKERLSIANSDLNRLQKQMSHIHGKENEFADTEKQLKNTMGALKNSLLKLKGQSAKKAAHEGIL